MKKLFNLFSKVALPINIGYAVILILFIADCQNWLDITSQSLKSFVYQSVLFALLPVLVVNWRLYSNYRIAFIVVCGCVLLLLFSPVLLLKLSFTSGTWVTYVVEYQNVNNPANTIEWQIQDVGALGENGRRVEVYQKNSLFMLVNTNLPDTSDKKVWKPVYIDYFCQYKKCP